MGNFRRKTLAAPELGSPYPEIYRRLKETNEKYPPTDVSSISTYLPDFSNAIELDHKVYRVNVPGYFYKCPGPTGLADTAHKSGLVIDRYNYRMNATSHHYHHAWIVHWGEDLQVSGYGGNSEMVYGEAGFKPHVDYVIDDKWSGFSVRCAGNPDALLRPGSFDVFAPTVSIGGVKCHVAIMMNQRMNPGYFPDSATPFTRDMGLDYFVCSGSGGFGGISNSLVPIIPGVKTTDYPGYLYDDGTMESKCAYCTGPTGGASWKSPAICETKSSHITPVIKVLNTDGKGTNLFFNILRDITKTGNVKSLTVVGLEEAMGTYVYFYREKGNTDKFYFVPCKTTPSGVKPITSIRSIDDPESCTCNLPEEKTELINQGPNSSCIMHTEGHTYSQMCRDYGDHIEGGSIEGNVFNSVIPGCGPIISPHTEPFDESFRDIFTHCKLTGHKEKFVAQILTLQPWPGVASFDDKDGIKHAAHTMFDPTIQGV